MSCLLNLTFMTALSGLIDQMSQSDGFGLWLIVCVGRQILISTFECCLQRLP